MMEKIQRCMQVVQIRKPRQHISKAITNNFQHATFSLHHRREGMVWPMVHHFRMYTPGGTKKKGPLCPTLFTTSTTHPVKKLEVFYNQLMNDRRREWIDMAALLLPNN